MAYKTEDMIADSLAVIKQHNLMFIEDIVAYNAWDKTTFYTHKLHENTAIKTALATNRIQTKNNLKAKWYKSDAPALQVALYKLIGSDDEYKRLANAKHEVDGGLSINIQIKEPDFSDD